MQVYPLGILVTTAARADLIAALVSRAAADGSCAAVFFTDAGVELLRDEAWLHQLAPARLAACDHSARTRGVPLREGITFGGQAQNALMLGECAHVIVV